MKKNFKDVKASDIDPDVRLAGKKYIDILMKA